MTSLGNFCAQKLCDAQLVISTKHCRTAHRSRCVIGVERFINGQQGLLSEIIRFSFAKYSPPLNLLFKQQRIEERLSRWIESAQLFA